MMWFYHCMYIICHCEKNSLGCVTKLSCCGAHHTRSTDPEPQSVTNHSAAQPITPCPGIFTGVSMATTAGPVFHNHPHHRYHYNYHQQDAQWALLTIINIIINIIIIIPTTIQQWLSITQDTAIPYRGSQERALPQHGFRAGHTYQHYIEDPYE